jgi:hypothetical protein
LVAPTRLQDDRMDAARKTYLTPLVESGGRMRAVIQRVVKATVEVERNAVGQIGPGLLVYLGVGKDDSDRDAEFMADKLVNLRRRGG